MYDDNQLLHLCPSGTVPALAISAKNTPIVTARGNSCLLGVGFAGMLGLEEMR